MRLSFQTTCKHPAAQLACEELKKEFTKLFGDLELGPDTVRLSVNLPENHDIDEYDINVDLAKSHGFISASNPRSLLFGAYRLLREIGFRWIRPGDDGEVLPPPPQTLPHIKLRDRACHRFRGICIEGAVSKENVLDTIRWMVKLGFNTYFIQFRDAYTFFARWYTHEENPLLKAESFDDERARELTLEVRQEVHSLGLELQMVGHGWTCEPFGIRGEGWYQSKQEISPETRRILAEVQGKRELWGGIALNTNLCYGQDSVRRRMVQAIVDYARENPDVDVVHFWLADAANNHCECALCLQKRPADWYVEILNEADQALTKEGIATRIVFLVYCDLLWPPEHAKLNHPERFILMFAPITRSYSRPFSSDMDDCEAPHIPSYTRNHIELPKSPAANLAFLSAWHQVFTGVGFDYDYHYMWDHFKDAGGMQIAQILHKDCRNLHRLSLDGLVSCQTQRAFFPHGLGMTVLGETLWNPSKPFKSIVSEYFQAAFGPNGDASRRYFESVSELFRPEALRGELGAEEYSLMLERLSTYDSIVERIQSDLNNGLKSSIPAWRKSWQNLSLHIEMCRLLRDFLRACPNSKENAETALASLIDWAQHNETTLQAEFDVFEFVTTFKERILPRILKAIGSENLS